MVVTLFEEALGVREPWYVDDVSFDPDKGLLTISIDFVAGTKFSVDDIPGTFGGYDTEVKQYRHLSFFQHECVLLVRVPRVKLADGRTRVISPPWSGQLRGFTLLFEAFVLLLAQQGMTFAAVGRSARITAYQAQ